MICTVIVKAVNTVPLMRSVGTLLVAFSGVELLGCRNSANGVSSIRMLSRKLPTVLLPLPVLIEAADARE